VYFVSGEAMPSELTAASPQTPARRLRLRALGFIWLLYPASSTPLERHRFATTTIYFNLLKCRTTCFKVVLTLWGDEEVSRSLA